MNGGATRALSSRIGAKNRIIAIAPQTENTSARTLIQPPDLRRKREASRQSAGVQTNSIARAWSDLFSLSFSERSVRNSVREASDGNASLGMICVSNRVARMKTAGVSTTVDS